MRIFRVYPGRVPPAPEVAIRPLALLSALLAVACSPAESPDYGQRDPCQNGYTYLGGDRARLVRIPSETWPDGLVAELLYPEAGAIALGVVLCVQGGFDPDYAPLGEEDALLETELGLVQLYLNLPGGDEEWSSPGVADGRGPEAREALALALDYAAGRARDAEGCTLEEHLPVELPELPPVLLGQSNGGNLLLQLLGDPELELPPLSGAVTFETPAGAQFVTVEVGSQSRENPGYTPDAWAWDPEEGLRVPVDYGRLAWSPSLGELGGAYFDLDGDGHYGADDLPVQGYQPHNQDDAGRIFYSPGMSAVLEERGLGGQAVVPPDEADAFWAERDGSRAVAPAVELHPELPFLVVGTEVDHTLGIPDHAHLLGLVYALERAGAAWVRLDPDASCVEELLPELDASLFPDLAANPILAPGSRPPLEPEESELGISSHLYNTAAVLELLLRQREGDWSPDLEDCHLQR